MFDKNSGGVDMTTLILMVVTATITILVGIMVLSQIEISTSPSITKSVLSTSATVALQNSGNAFNMLALGLFVSAAVFIIGIVAGVLGKKD